MNIALDYDGTYTKDPQFWERFIESAMLSEHKVMIFTKRHPEEKVDVACGSTYNLEIHYTERIDKLFYAGHNEIKVDIWIDNNPFDIVGYPK